MPDKHFIEHKILRGQGAGRWLPFARTKVAALHARADGAALSQRWKLEGGMVEIAVRVVGDQRYIHIRRKECPPFLSGFCDLVLHTFPSVRTPVWQVPDPDDPDATINVFRRFYPSPATPAQDRVWRDDPGLARNQTAADQMLSLKPSMYSGEMRKVVQVLQGMNVELPYSPHFTGTHGVYVAENGQRWIVEISSYGVLAWPMTMCRNPIMGAAGDLLDYTPISTPKPLDTQEARDAGRLFELIDPPKMQEFYTHAPMFPHCGWAFSEDGHKVANVCWDKFGGFEHVHTYLYEITIVELEGRPSTATLAQISTGIYHGDRVYAQVKFPNNLTGSLFSFDTLYGVHIQVISDAPIYTFYDGSTRIDAYYANDPFAGGTQVFNDNFQDSCGNTNLGRMGVEFKSGSITYDPTPHFRITGLGELPGAVIGGPMSYQTQTLPSAVGQWGQEDGAFGSSQIKDVYAMVTESGNRSSVAQQFYAFVVPYGEREAFYLAQRHESTNTYSSRNIDVRPVTFQPFYAREHVCSCGSAGAAPGPGEPLIMAPGAPQPISVSCDGAPAIIGLGNGGPYLPGGYNGTTQTKFQLAGDPSLCGMAGDNSGNCGYIPNMYSQVCPGVGACMQASFPGQVETVQSFGVEFHGSGGVRAVFHPDELQNAWFSFLPPEESQFVVAQRDAFVPGKMIVSQQIDAIDAPDLYSTADEYPVSEAGQFFNLNFVGIP